MLSGTRLSEELRESEILYWVGRSLGNLRDGRNLVQISHHVMVALHIAVVFRKQTRASQPAHVGIRLSSPVEVD